MMNVSDILRTKGPQFNRLDGNTSVADALTLMNSEGFDHVVVTKNGEYAGVFLEKGYTRTVTHKGKDFRNELIAELMSNELPIVDIDVSIESCYRIMNAYKTSCLPVFDNFSFMGVITLNDVINKILLNSETV